MPPSHHPRAQVLADLLTGECSPGAALLVARHVEGCAQCTARVQAMGAQPAAVQETVYDPPQPLGPGIEVARARGASGLGEVVLWIRAEPGRTLPLDAPLPAVEVLVLAGGFGADGVRFGPGDFLCLAAGPLRDAVSDGEQGCVCLATCEDTAGLLDD